MHPRPLPGPVHPAARVAVELRWAQVQRRLLVATGVRLLAGALAVLVLPISHGPTAGVVVVLGAVLLAHAGLELVERDATHRRTPLRWTVLAAPAGVLAGICAVLALLPLLVGLPLLVADLIGLVVAVAVACTVLVATSRAAGHVLAPGCPEVGGTELRLWLPGRHTGRWWANPGSAVLVTADELRLSTLLGHAPERRVPLAAVSAVSLQPGPLLRLDVDASWGGSGSTVLAVGGDDAAAGSLAAVLRYRVWALSGHTPADVAVLPVAPSAALSVHPLPHVPGPAVANLPTTDFRPRPPARP